MKTVVQAGQTLLDIAIQEYGTIEAVFMLAKANDMSITDTLQAGRKLKYRRRYLTANWLITANGIMFVRPPLRLLPMQYV